jgi:hypothetical protein
MPQSIEDAEKYLGLVAKMVATSEHDDLVMISIRGSLPPLPMAAIPASSF